MKGGATMKKSAILSGLFVAALSSLAVAPAAAQSRGNPGVIVMDEVRIEGRIEKPEVFYGLSRAQDNFILADLRRSFTDEILRSVTTTPF